MVAFVRRAASLFACLALSGLAGCAGSDDAGAQEDDLAAAVSWKPLSFVLPTGHTGKDAEEIFSSEDEFRTYFGTSCGLLCTNKYKGAMPVSMSDPSGKLRFIAYVQRAGVPQGRSLAIKAISRDRNKWLKITTCTKPSSTTSKHVVAVVDGDGSQPIIWVTKPEGSTGLEAC